jgi:linoleoyl-CoA desaturase
VGDLVFPIPFYPKTAVKSQRSYFMTQTVFPPLTMESIKKLKFAQNTEFRATLNRRVEDFFKTTGRQKRDCLQMYLKTFIILVSLVASYMFLVFFAQQWWQALILSIVVGIIATEVGFNIQHDGSHNAYSDIPWVNKMMSMSMDLMGLSSYYWKIGHNVLHHQYVNLTGYDQDIDLGILARKTPYQQWFPHHRWQHYYLWFFYGLYIVQWCWISDFENLFRGKFYDIDYPKPKGIELVIFLSGKAIFFTLAIGIPLIFHSIWNVLLCYLLVQFTAGTLRGIVCASAHENDEVTFTKLPEESSMVESEWAVHQIENTVNFANHNNFVTWFTGGVNFQIEHHLFPNICHVNYPLIAPLVEETCKEFGIKYQKYESVGDALLSHFRLLRRLGKSSSTL